MTSFLDDLFPASFKGVPFFVENASLPGGRRFAVHEFPQVELPTAEDTGKKPKYYQIKAYLGGEAVAKQRSILIEALEGKAEAGYLVHPQYGRLWVVCTDWSNNWSVDAGGIEHFDLVFLLLGKKTDQRPLKDTATVVKTTATALEATLDASLTANIEKASRIDQLKTVVANILSQQMATLNKSIAGIDSLTQKSKIAITVLQSPSQLIQSFSNPPVLVAQIQGLYRNLSQVSGLSSERVRQLRSLLGQQQSTTPFVDLPPAWRVAGLSSVETNLAQAVIRQVEKDAMRRTVLTVATLSSDLDFESNADAQALKQDLGTALSTIAQEASEEKSPELYAQALALQSAISLDLTQRALEAPQVNQVTLQVPIPAFMLSYDIYQTLNEADTLLLRNPQAVGGILPAFQPIQYLEAS